MVQFSAEARGVFFFERQDSYETNSSFSRWVAGSLWSEIKWPECEFDDSPSSSAEVLS
jgi:hypothetical protein